ncbi:MAG TPA: hypothetical protein VF179_08950 [Thermoanaerobaculia bacterium]|nr:hypothetical protein [Thermoanaerobaculia bacterium]
MATERNLADLREEYRNLASQSFRIGWVSVLSLLLLVIAFSRAFSRVDSAEVDDLLKGINDLSKNTRREPEISYVFRGLFDKIQTAGRNFQTLPDDVEPEGSEQAEEKQRALEIKLDRLAEEWFSIDSSILGTPLNLDLRYWIVLLPIVIGGGGGLLYILRVKQSIVAAVAARLLERAEPSERPVLDRLLFEGPGSTAYSTFPAQPETIAYLGAVVGLSGYLLSVALPVWPLWEGVGPSLLLSALVAGTVYVSAICITIRSRLWQQAQDLAEVSRPPGWSDRAGAWLARPRGWLARRNPFRQPRRKLLAGGSLVLLTLILTMATSCDEQGNELEAKGYELIFPSEEWMDWPTSSWVEKDPWFQADLGGLSSQMDRAAYVLALALAMTALAVTFNRTVLQSPRALRVLALLAGSLLVYFLSDLAAIIAMASFPGAALVYHFLWVIPLFLLLRFRFSKHEGNRARWSTTRRALLVLYLPGVFASFTTLYFFVVFFGVLGYPVFYLGLIPLSLGYLQLADSQPAQG